jgi:hypothetical protein
MIPRALIVCLASTLVACAPRQDPRFEAGDPSVMAGTWTLIMHHRGSPDALGTVHLALPTLHEQTLPWESLPPTPYLAGTFALQQRGWLGRPPVKNLAKAYVAPDGQAWIWLAVGGNCGDCGDVTLMGHLDSASVTGRWSQEFLGDEPHGSFELRRAR